MKRSLLNEAVRIAVSSSKRLAGVKFTHWSFIVQRNKLLDGSPMKLTEPPVHFGYRDIMRRKEPDRPHPWVHSELAAYKKAIGIMDRDKPFECINVAFTERGIVRMSCPCGACQSFLKAVGCSKVYFTTAGGVFAELKL